MNWKTLLPLILMISCSYMQAPPRTKVQLKTLWIKNHDPAQETGNLPMGLHSPLIYEGIVFSGHNQGKMRAYELSNGRLVWESQDDSTYHGGFAQFKDQVIYGTTKGRVFSRHCLTGNLKYAIDLDGSIESVGQIENGRLLFHTRSHKIFCLDPETGKILWAYKRSVPFSTTIQRASRPVINNNNVYVGFADGFIVSLSLAEGIVLWERKLATGAKFIDVDTTPFFFNNELLVSSLAGDVFGLDPKTGNIIRKLDYSIGRSPVALENHIFIATVSGELVKFSESFNEVDKIKLSDAPLMAFAQFKGKLVVSAADGKVFVVDPLLMEVLEMKLLGHPYSTVYGDMESKENHLAFMSSRNRLFIFH